MNTLMKVLILVTIAFGLAACGGGAKSEPVTFNIDMTEYKFTPAALELKVGQQVTLNLTNSGQLPHSVMFGRGVEMVNNRPAAYQTDMFAGGEQPQVTQDIQPEAGAEMAHDGFMVVLPVGAKATVTFTVTDDMVGTWEMGCFEQDGVHYDAGMKGPVTVSP
jgi:uncharacterized cupredoxin-like copper-binding protein